MPQLTSVDSRAPQRVLGLRLVLVLALALALAGACSDDGSQGTDTGPADATGSDQGSDATTGDQAGDPSEDASLAEAEAAALAAVSPTSLKTAVDTLAADDTYGRITGSPGHLQARDWIVEQMTTIGLEPFGDDGGYLQAYATGRFRGHYQRESDGSIVENDADTGWNIVGRLPGSDPAAAGEYVVVMAHYDHLGVSQDGEDIYNGAFDDASGVATALELARVLVAEGVVPRRSVAFVITDQEEAGLIGADRWLVNSPMPLEDIVVGISLDPVGRNLLPDFGPIVIMGLERSPQLATFWRQTTSLTERPIGFLHREMIPGFASDQDRFYEDGIPAMWLTTPGMSFYHTPEDDPETVDYANLRDVTRYLVRSVLLVGSTDERFEYVGSPVVDATDAADGLVLLEGLMTSTALTDGERTQIQGYITDLQQVVENDDWSVVGNPLLYFGQVLTFVAFQLPIRHPGPIPPPFPEE